MKLSLLSLVAVAVSQSYASPLRVLVLEGPLPPSPSTIPAAQPAAIRFGHPVSPHSTASAVAHHAAHVVPVVGFDKPWSSAIPGAMPMAHHAGPCRMRNKFLEISNTIRKTLGLPTIEPSAVAPVKIGEGEFKILPFVGTPGGPTFIKTGSNPAVPNFSPSFAGLGPVKFPVLPPTESTVMTKGGDSVRIIYSSSRPQPPMMMHHQHGKFGCFKKWLAKEGFVTRLHVALMTLGPWEGRAVAFVLGCGIGVLLRMIWVLSVITYRSIKGESEDDNLDRQTEATYILLQSEEAPEVIFVDNDEKAVLKAAEGN